MRVEVHARDRARGSQISKSLNVIERDAVASGTHHFLLVIHSHCAGITCIASEIKMATSVVR